jgi:hypothetical protein
MQNTQEKITTHHIKMISIIRNITPGRDDYFSKTEDTVYVRVKVKFALE